MFQQACIAGISPIEFDNMYLWQVMEAVRGYDERTKRSAQIMDRIADKLIAGLNFAKPKHVTFAQLFPQWAQPEQREQQITPEQQAVINMRRLDAWADESEV